MISHCRKICWPTTKTVIDQELGRKSRFVSKTAFVETTQNSLRKLSSRLFWSLETGVVAKSCRCCFAEALASKCIDGHVNHTLCSFRYLQRCHDPFLAMGSLGLATTNSCSCLCVISTAPLQKWEYQRSGGCMSFIARRRMSKEWVDICLSFV